MPDFYITTKNGLAFDDSLTAPADGEYGLQFSTGSGLGFGAVPVKGGAGNVPLLSISGTPGNAVVGTPYSFTPTVTGGSGTKTFALVGSLPAGLSFNTATGAITGTPTTEGTTSGIGITVSDNSGSAALSAFSIAVTSLVTGSALKLAASLSFLLLAGGGKLLLAQG